MDLMAVVKYVYHISKMMTLQGSGMIEFKKRIYKELKELYKIIENLTLPPGIEQCDRHKRPTSSAIHTELQQTRQAGHHKVCLCI